MDKKFTSGPHYAVEYSGYWDLQTEPGYNIDNNLLNEEVCEEAPYNAKLYAAAPEMYDLLEECKDCVPAFVAERIDSLLNRIDNV